MKRVVEGTSSNTALHNEQIKLRFRIFRSSGSSVVGSGFFYFPVRKVSKYSAVIL